MKIGIIGCGNLGASLVKGINTNHPDQEIIASKRNIDKIQHLASENVVITANNLHLIEQCDILIFALKPYTLLPFIQEHRKSINSTCHTIVSVATGITISEIQEAFGAPIGIYRAMPNTAASVNESMTAIAANNDPLQRQEMITNIFNTLGSSIQIDESLMDAATILGACGIAYVLRFIRAMIQGGIEVGFDAQTATENCKSNGSRRFRATFTKWNPSRRRNRQSYNAKRLHHRGTK